MPPPEPSLRAAWGVFAATAMAGFLRFFRLDAQSLWVDEIFTWLNADIGGRLALSDVLTNDHGPLLQVILHALGGWFGDSEFVLRLPSALASVALVPVSAALAGRVLGPQARVPAAWLAALSPFLVWYGQEARNYALAMLFASAAAWAAVRWHQRGGRVDGLWFVLLAWLGLLSNLNVALILPVLALYVALPHGGRRGRPGAVALALMGLVVLESPWIVEYLARFAWGRLVPGREALPQEVPLRGATTFSWGGYPFTFSTFSIGYTLGPSLRELHESPPLRAALRHAPVLGAAALVFGGLALRGLVALRRRPAPLWLAVGLVLVPLLAVTYFAVQNFKVFNPRYLSAGIAGYYLILTAGWLALRPRWRVGAAAAVVVLWVASLGQWYFDPAYGKEDFRAATGWLAERIGPGDQLIATANYGPLRYYWRGRQPEYQLYWLGYARQPGRLEETFRRLEEPERVRWIVVSRPEHEDPEYRLERYLVEERGAEVQSFPGVRIYRLPPEGPDGARAEAPNPWPEGNLLSGKVARMASRKWRA